MIFKKITIASSCHEVVSESAPNCIILRRKGVKTIVPLLRFDFLALFFVFFGPYVLQAQLPSPLCYSKSVLWKGGYPSNRCKIAALSELFDGQSSTFLMMESFWHPRQISTHTFLFPDEENTPTKSNLWANTQHTTHSLLHSHIHKSSSTGTSKKAWRKA
jgi:hypothetical protein